MNPASGAQLAQTRPSGVSAVTAFSANELRAEITLIFVTNTTGTAADMSIYHDDDGTTYNADSALYETVSVAANSTTRIAFEVGSGIMVGRSGNIGVKTGTANALNFTFYGTTETKA